MAADDRGRADGGKEYMRQEVMRDERQEVMRDERQEENRTP